MIIQINNPPNFSQMARRIKVQASSVLKTWGLVPRFKRWRLSRDPITGMVVLFGVLNNSYIARYTSIPFSNYFDPRILHDLANKLQVQVVSGNSDGLRYAFILSRGYVDPIPTQINVPVLDGHEIFPVFITDWSAQEIVEGRIGLTPPNAAGMIADDQP